MGGRVNGIFWNMATFRLLVVKFLIAFRDITIRCPTVSPFLHLVLNM